MKGRLFYFSKSQLLILFGVIIGFLAVTPIGVFASSHPVQIATTTEVAKMCVFVRSDYTNWRSHCNDYHKSYFNENYKGYTIKTTAHFHTGGCSFWRCESHCEAYGSSLVPINLPRYGTTYCPPLDEMFSFTIDEGSEVSEGGSFTFRWSAPTAESCKLSGKARDGEKFSDTFSGSGSHIKGARTYSNITERGIYPFKFECSGYANNKISLRKGTISKEHKVYVGNIPPPPTVTFKSDISSITSGGSATLSWTSQNAISISINQGISVVAKSGSIKVTPKFTTRYTITAHGEFEELGLAQHSATVRVVAATSTQGGEVPDDVPPDPEVIDKKEVVKPEVGLLINGKKGPLTIGAPANISLSWKANQYCIAYGSWLGIKTKAGQEARTLTKPGTYTYTLYCPGLGSEQVKVTIAGSGGSGGSGSVAMPVAEASISTDGKNFQRSIRVIRGKATHIWLSAGYDTNGDRRISRDDAGGWSASLSNGGQCDWNYDLNQGVPTFDVGIPDPKSAKDCAVDLGEVTFYDQPGDYTYGVLRLVQVDGKVSKTASINIMVDAPHPPDTAPVIDLQVNGMKDRVTLGTPASYAVMWNVHNADTCTASDDWKGDKFLRGSQNFVASTRRDLAYTLTCVGKLGTTTKSILVKVTELPVCDFSALPTTLNKSSVFERESVLTWKCQFANTCSISPSTGASTGTFGSARVSPADTTTYTLACQNLDGSSSFNQTVELK